MGRLDDRRDWPRHEDRVLPRARRGRGSSGPRGCPNQTIDEAISRPPFMDDPFRACHGRGDVRLLRLDRGPGRAPQDPAPLRRARCARQPRASVPKLPSGSRAGGGRAGEAGLGEARVAGVIPPDAPDASAHPSLLAGGGLTPRLRDRARARGGQAAGSSHSLGIRRVERPDSRGALRAAPRGIQVGSARQAVRETAAAGPLRGPRAGSRWVEGGGEGREGQGPGAGSSRVRRPLRRNLLREGRRRLEGVGRGAPAAGHPVRRRSVLPN